MHVDIKGIVEGIGNAVMVKEQVEKIAQYRIDICNNCEHYSPNIKNKGLNILYPYKYCDDCKCNMYLKTRSLAAKCPLGGYRSKFPLETSKWPAYTDEDTAKKLMEVEGLKEDIIAYKIKMSKNQVQEHGD